MKIDGLKMPKSSFLSMEKDMNLIINKMFKNERLKRLLHYTSRDALRRPNITEDEALNLIKEKYKNWAMPCEFEEVTTNTNQI